MSKYVSDAELIKGCLNNQREMCYLLYQKYAPKMFGICIRYLPNRMDAEDALQDIFIKIFKNLRSYGFKGSFEGWIRKATIHTCLNIIRANKANGFYVTDLIIPYEINSDDIDDEIFVTDEKEDTEKNIKSSNKYKPLNKYKKVYHTEVDANDIIDNQASIHSKLNTRVILKILQDLPVGYRTVFNLFEIEGYSHKEIAKIMNISVSTSKTQFLKAKRAIRKKLEELKIVK
jgi:RNA polymerase sigma-70 factor (ECF subfamily)